MIERMRPMSEAPERNCKGAWALGTNCTTCPRCIETKPEAPEPEAPILPPSKGRAAFQLFSAAHESVALGQSLAEFQALAGVAHAQATKRAARVGR